MTDIGQNAATSKTGLTAGLYVRVSTGRQEQEETIQAQTEAVRTAIKQDGNHLGSDCVFGDDGWTGELLARPGLDSMRSAAMEGRFQILYAYDRGRLSRLYAHQEVILEELESNHVLFRSLRDVPADTPEAKVMQAMQGVFQQYERVKIAERFRMAKLFKAKNGVLINGQLPYGYTRVSKSDSSPAVALINEEHREVVRQIRIWFGLERLSVHRIIGRLHDMGIAPPRQRDVGWRKATIIRLLQMDTYHTGLVYYNKTEAIIPRRSLRAEKYKRVRRTSRRLRPREEWLPIKVPRLVEDDGLFEKIQERLRESGRIAPKNQKYRYLLSGKVFCSCGNRRVGDGCNGHHYYRCAERVYKYPVRGECRLPGRNAPILDEAVWAHLHDLLVRPKALQAHATGWLRALGNVQAAAEADAQRVQQQIEGAEAEEQRYLSAYGGGFITFEQFRKAMDSLKRRSAKLKTLLAGLDYSRKAKHDMPSATELGRECKRILGSLSSVDRSVIVQELVQRVVVKADNIVEVIANLPVMALNVGENHEAGDTSSAIPHLEFRFSLTTPKARKARTILERDRNGRILSSSVP